MEPLKNLNRITEAAYKSYKRISRLGGFVGYLLMFLLWLFAFKPALRIDWLFDNLNLAAMGVILAFSIFAFVLVGKRKRIDVEVNDNYTNNTEVYIRPFLSSFFMALMLSSGFSCLLFIFKATT